MRWDHYMQAMDTEEWRPIPGWEGSYEASSEGRIRSLTRIVTNRLGVARTHPGRVLSPTTEPTGHLHVNLWRSGRQNVALVHRQILMAFIGPCPPGMEACHNDGDPANNAIRNLRWDTHIANMLDRTEHGTCPNSQKTHCPANHPYDEENTIVSRGRRHCRICQRERGRRYDRERRVRKAAAA